MQQLTQRIEQRLSSETVVGIADMKIAQGDQILATYALGSCVGLCIYDEVLQLGGLLHAMLPVAGNEHDNPLRYVDTGVPELVRAMRVRGADPRRMKAKLVGGAKMFEFNVSSSTGDIGSRNVTQVKQTLKPFGIPIVLEDTGGKIGRTIRFSPRTGQVTILNANKTQRVI